MDGASSDTYLLTSLLNTFPKSVVSYITCTFIHLEKKNIHVKPLILAEFHGKLPFEEGTDLAFDGKILRGKGTGFDTNVAPL